MLGPQELAGAFERNANIVKMQADGLTDAESLLQLPFQGNCLNWVIGHIIDNRDSVLKTLGEPPIFGAEGARYKRGSEALVEPDDTVLSLEDLLVRLDLSQQRIAGALAGMTSEELSQERTFGERKSSMEGRIFFLYFHETYHVGQTELLRQLAGKNDKII